MKWADLYVGQHLFARLDSEGSALGSFVVEPRAKKVEQALAFGVDVCAGPPSIGASVVPVECRVDRVQELCIARGGGHLLECGLILNLGPETFEDGMDEATALTWVEAERDGIERGGEEALLGEGSEAACGLRCEDACTALQDAIRWRRN